MKKLSIIINEQIKESISLNKKLLNGILPNGIIESSYLYEDVIFSVCIVKNVDSISEQQIIHYHEKAIERFGENNVCRAYAEQSTKSSDKRNPFFVFYFNKSVAAQ